MDNQQILLQLAHQRKIVALEASIPEALAASITKTIPGLVSDMKVFFTHFPLSDSSPQVTGKQKDFLKALAKQNYTGLVSVNLFVPEGMISTYTIALQAIKEATLYVGSTLDVLSDYTTFLGSLINIREQLKSTDFNRQKLEVISNTIDTLNKAYGQCFKPGLTATEQPYRKLLNNNREWESVFLTLNEVNKEIVAVDRTKIKKKIEEGMHQLDMIQNKFKRGELDGLSPEMLEKITDYTYHVANLLQFFSVTFYRVKAITTAINDSVDKLDKILKVANG